MSIPKLPVYELAPDSTGILRPEIVDPNKLPKEPEQLRSYFENILTACALQLRQAEGACVVYGIAFIHIERDRLYVLHKVRTKDNKTREAKPEEYVQHALKLGVGVSEYTLDRCRNAAEQYLRMHQAGCADISLVADHCLAFRKVPSSFLREVWDAVRAKFGANPTRNEIISVIKSYGLPAPPTRPSSLVAFKVSNEPTLDLALHALDALQIDEAKKHLRALKAEFEIKRGEHAPRKRPKKDLDSPPKPAPAPVPSTPPNSPAPANNQTGAPPPSPAKRSAQTATKPANSGGDRTLNPPAPTKDALVNTPPKPAATPTPSTTPGSSTPATPADAETGANPPAQSAQSKEAATESKDAPGEASLPEAPTPPSDKSVSTTTNTLLRTDTIGLVSMFLRGNRVGARYAKKFNKAAPPPSVKAMKDAKMHWEGEEREGGADGHQVIDLAGKSSAECLKFYEDLREAFRKTEGVGSSKGTSTSQEAS